MNKLILENRSDLDMFEFMQLAMSVVAEGRVSNDGKQYGYLTVFFMRESKYHIVSELNEKSDKLILYKCSKTKGE